MHPHVHTYTYVCKKFAKSAQKTSIIFMVIIALKFQQKIAKNASRTQVSHCQLSALFLYDTKDNYAAESYTIHGIFDMAKTGQ